MRLIRALRWLVCLPPGLAYAQSSSTDVDTVFSRQSLYWGVQIDRATCEQSQTSLWISVLGEDFCVRYYLAPRQERLQEAIVYIHGDVTASFYESIEVPAKDLPAYAQSQAARLARRSRVTSIFLARMGAFGSSGHHRDKHSVLETAVANGALDAIKERHNIETFHLVGHSGGANLALNLSTFRTDLGCLVLGAGRLFWSDPVKLRERKTIGPRRLIDPADIVATIDAWGGRHVFVVSDPRDTYASFAEQARFVDAMRERGRPVEHILANATDSHHHDVVGQSFRVMVDCVNGLDAKSILERHHKDPIAAANGIPTRLDQWPPPQ